jgi:hypothetical protein
VSLVEVRERVAGRAVVVAWRDGEVSGDRSVLRALRASVGGRARLTPTGPDYPIGVDDPFQFFASTVAALDEIDSVRAEGTARLPPRSRRRLGLGTPRRTMGPSRPFAACLRSAAKPR